MKETEVKILNVNFNEVRKKLKTLKARHVGKKLQEDFLFINAYLKKNHMALRLRKVNNKVILTYKGKKDKIKNYKVREEIEVRVSDLKQAKIILNNLGFEDFMSIIKKVDFYKLDNVSIELVKINKVTPYVELEGSIENISKVAKKLGFNKKQFSALSKSELINRYSK